MCGQLCYVSGFATISTVALSLFLSNTDIIIIISSSSSSSIQLLGRYFWQEPEPSQATGMALARCILGNFLGVVCHCFPLPLDVPTFAVKCLQVPNNASAPSSERWNRGREWSGNIAEMTLFTPFRDLLHAANLRQRANSFTSLPSEGK
jgi:hypothetical protein